METMQWIQEWYKTQCDGDWEHEYGIKVQTLDNPGWDVTIDLFNTEMEEVTIPWVFYEQADNDWWGYKVTDSVYQASGDPNKLVKLFAQFRELVEQSA